MALSSRPYSTDSKTRGRTLARTHGRTGPTTSYDERDPTLKPSVNRPISVTQVIENHLFSRLFGLLISIRLGNIRSSSALVPSASQSRPPPSGRQIHIQAAGLVPAPSIYISSDYTIDLELNLLTTTISESGSSRASIFSNLPADLL